MTRETVAAELMKAERELREAQRDHDDTYASTVRYRDARDRLVQLQRLATVLSSMSDPTATLAA